MNGLPPEIIAAIASGITSLIAFIIRWLETRVFKAKIAGHKQEAQELQAQVEELRKALGRKIWRGEQSTLILTTH